MIDVASIDKANTKIVSTFYSNFIYLLIYFGTLVYIYKYMENKTSKDNNLTAMENNFMYLLFILFISYFVVSLFTKGVTLKHRIFMVIIVGMLMIYGNHYKNVAFADKSILSSSFLMPYILIILLTPLFVYVNFFRKYTFDLVLPSVESFNTLYSEFSNILRSLYIVMIVYVIVYRQYNYNTPSSNTLQPLILGPIVVVSLFYFIAKFVTNIGMVKKYNITNVMISLYLIFSIFVCFYLYTFIMSLNQLAKENPETALARKREEEEFAKKPGIEKYISKYVIFVMIFCLLILYWIRDIVHWGRISALGYIFITIMLIYTSKVVAETKNGIGGFFSALYFVEWLLITKLRWNSVFHSLNIIFSGVEVTNRDVSTVPSLMV
jgi:hypothetical protein